MSNSTMTSAANADQGAAMEQRLVRGMVITTVAATALSLPLLPWRMTSGVLLGGLLALFNYRWLHAAVVSALSANSGSGKSVFGVGRFALRYLIVGLVVASSYVLDIVSLTATLVGLSSFAVAGLLEALRQIYYALITREEV